MPHSANPTHIDPVAAFLRRVVPYGGIDTSRPSVHFSNVPQQGPPAATNPVLTIRTARHPSRLHFFLRPRPRPGPRNKTKKPKKD
jgi:hypothetical protein